jgi:hypothetical protein
MQRIEPETRRKMARSWGIATALFAIPCARAFFLIPSVDNLSPLLLLIVAPLLISCLPLVVAYGAAKQTRHAAARANWREAYRESPKSHVLHLND